MKRGRSFVAPVSEQPSVARVAEPTRLTQEFQTHPLLAELRYDQPESWIVEFAASDPESRSVAEI